MITKFMLQLKHKSIVGWPITNLFFFEPVFLLGFVPESNLRYQLKIIIDLYLQSQNYRALPCCLSPFSFFESLDIGAQFQMNNASFKNKTAEPL